MIIGKATIAWAAIIILLVVVLAYIVGFIHGVKQVARVFDLPNGNEEDKTGNVEKD